MPGVKVTDISTLFHSRPQQTPYQGAVTGMLILETGKEETEARSKFPVSVKLIVSDNSTGIQVLCR